MIASMVRTTVMVDQIVERLKALAAERGVSLSMLIREALEEKAGEYRPKPSFLGMFDSGTTDTSTTIATDRLPHGTTDAGAR